MILKPRKAHAAYRQMLRYYAAKTFLHYFESRPQAGFRDFLAEMDAAPGAAAGERVRDWVNLGGQVVPAFRLDALRRDIREGKLQTWEEIHAVYGEMAAAYPQDRCRHAWAVLGYLGGTASPLPDAAALIAELDALAARRRWITEQVYLSRAKDFHDPFRGITYRNREEMEAVAGTAAENSFVKLVQKQTVEIENAVETVKKRL